MQAYRRFVDETGYVIVAERPLKPKLSGIANQNACIRVRWSFIKPKALFISKVIPTRGIGARNKLETPEGTRSAS